MRLVDKMRAWKKIIDSPDFKRPFVPILRFSAWNGRPEKLSDKTQSNCAEGYYKRPIPLQSHVMMRYLRYRYSTNGNEGDKSQVVGCLIDT